ncbi:MAG: NAD(+)/NADH kinase, partial [Wenzhouxiangella sp.]
MTARPALGFLASEHPGAREALAELEKRYGRVAPDRAEVLVVLGGDGFMLHTLHEHARLDLPVFGMRLGDVGFLMNRYAPEDLPDRIAAARPVTLNPL